MEWLIAAGVIFVAIGLIVAVTPRYVRYTETLDIAAETDEVYDHIRFQQRLMRWSAWPSETGSDCACEGIDGEVGARTSFFTKKGERFGFQEVTALVPGRRIEMVLKSKGPPQRPKLAFDLQVLADGRTRVDLQFDNQIARPFNVLLRVIGVVRWTRDMHRKDLRGLKAYAEPPHRTYDGDEAVELRPT